jgi:hypothetical protein
VYHDEAVNGFVIENSNADYNRKNEMLPSCTNEMLFRKNEMLPSSTAHINK